MIRDRDTLKAFFTTGARPTEGNFSDLIDSMYNKMDDEVLSDYIDGAEKTKAVFAEIKNTPQDGLSFINVANNTALMSIKPDGKVGIGVDKPSHTLEVNGTIATNSKVGTYVDIKVDASKVLADGKWHEIITGLDGLNIFEITASSKGLKGKGEYALLYAVAMSAYGNSKSKIIQHSARYKGVFHNICLRWTGTVNDYNLEIRTTKNFGKSVPIQYFITKLISEND